MGGSALARDLSGAIFAAYDNTPTSADKLVKKLDAHINSAIRDGPQGQRYGNGGKGGKERLHLTASAWAPNTKRDYGQKDGHATEDCYNRMEDTLEAGD